MSFVSIVPNTPTASTQDLAAIAGSKLGKRGRILEHSTFDNGSLQGWANQHWGTYAPQPPLTTTTYPIITGTHAMLLSTQEAPFVLNGDGSRPYGADVSAYKRLANYNPLYGRYRSLSALVAVGSGGQANEPAWQQWGLVMDVQRMDNSTRSFCRAYCVYKEPDGTYPYGRTLWYVINDAGTLIPVPGSSFVSTGENENKMGYNYVRLTFDDQANSGVGGYYELQVNDKVFDLTGLGAGRGMQAPQAGDWMADYRGGMNPGLLLNQRTVGAAAAAIPGNAWPAYMTVDQTLMTQGDVPV